MAIVGLDDTDSASGGMCTTYLASVLADQLGDDQPTTLLFRLNPAIPHKTRGNGAVAVYTDAPRNQALGLAANLVEKFAILDDPHTNPAIVSVEGDGSDLPTETLAFAVRAIREEIPLREAERLAGQIDATVRRWKNGRGLVGALAAVGAMSALCRVDHPFPGLLDDWTVEYLVYRPPHEKSRERRLDRERLWSVLGKTQDGLWDNRDPETGSLTCIPHSPCPVICGIRGDDDASVRAVGSAVEAPDIDRSRLFVTNQGTDAHLRSARAGRVRNRRSYRITGTVVTQPNTGTGGHVALHVGDSQATMRWMAFEPTKRFRATVRKLRPGDRVTGCGEVTDGTLKLEKIYVHELVDTQLVSPTCPGCARTMKSAGRGQGYRCRDCGAWARSKSRKPLARELDTRAYEVPPAARRHLARPLCR